MSYAWKYFDSSKHYPWVAVQPSFEVYILTLREASNAVTPIGIKTTPTTMKMVIT
jgi:hypothetical protein